MGVYDEEIADAAEAIAEAGRSVILRPKGAAIDNARPWAGQADGVDLQPIQAAFFPYGDQSRPSQGEGSGASYQRIEKCLVAAQGLAFEIDTSYQIVDGSFLWDILAIPKILKPGDQVIFYELTVGS